MKDNEVTAMLAARGVTRLTHFTNSRNLPRILRTGEIMSTARLDAAGITYERTDPERYDGRLDHVCCNIEYPNMFYFRKASGRDNTVNYSDWSVLLLDPQIAAREGTLFAPGNAAFRRGAELTSGVEGLARMYASKVHGRSRSGLHCPASPTDVQAEVLIPGIIRVSDVRGIVVPDESSLLRERGRLNQIGYDPGVFEWFVSAQLFQKYSVVSAVQDNSSVPLIGPWNTYVKEDQ